VKEEILDHTGSCLAFIIPKSFGEYGTSFLTSPENPLQVGVIQRHAGDVIPGHNHKPCSLSYEGQRQEFIHILEGRVRISILDDDGKEVDRRILEPGDSLLQLRGGHRFDFELPTKMIEVKQGPYFGKEKDKVLHE
jgi:mannose-6-phosphate isomerase-like protein (cupin superfamily)